jgi:tetratricopeptide (TPR) repeat protein
MTLFLSYAAEDRILATAVARGLSATGLGVWCEALPEGLPAALTWARRLETAIEHCDGYLVMLSERGLENWVRADLDYVIRLRARREKDGRPFSLVTLLEGGFTPRRLPGFLSSYPAITLPGGIDRSGPEGFGGLAKQIRSALQGKAPPPHQETTNPFPGLEPFDEYRGRFLFGRELEIREAVERLGGPGDNHRRWLQIEGPSGIGKSSLARAGVVPAVRRGWVEGAPKAWRVGLFRPGMDPIRSLAQAFVKALRRELGGAFMSPDEVVDDLWKGEGALSNLLRKYTPAGHGFLLVADQLEEAFMLAGADRSAARRFDGLLANALREKDGPLYLVTTIRSDATGRFSELPELEYLLNGKAARYHLKMMSASGLLAAIEGPSSLTGIRCAPQLPERLVNEALSTEDGLPLLAHTLRLLWTVRTGSILAHETHDRLGGVAGALGRSADAMVDSLGKESRDRAMRLFLALVNVRKGAEDSLRTLKRADALEALGGGPEAEQMLLRLSGGRDPDKPDSELSARIALITASETEDRVDLVHDVILRQWRTFRTWIDRRRKGLDRGEDLEAAAQAWEAAGSPRDDVSTGAVFAYLRTAEAQSERARAYLAAAAALEAKRETEKAFESQDRVEFERKRGAYETHVRDAIEAAERLLFDVDRELGQVPGAEPAREHLSQTAAQILDRLLLCAGDGKSGQRMRMLSHSRRGDLALARNDFGRARREYDTSMKIARQLVDSAPSEMTYAFDLAVCAEKLGDIYQALGDLGKALASYRSAIEISEAVAATEPQNAQLKRDLLVVYNKAGSTAHAQNNLGLARAYFEKAAAATELIAREEPKNAQLRRDLSVAYQMLGTVTRAQGNMVEARAYLEKDLAITKSLAQADPRNPQLQRDLSISYEMLGEVAKAAGNVAEARAYFEKDLVIMRGLAQADPQNGQLQRDLSMSYEMLGDMLQASGSIAEARACFEKSLEIRKALAEADPDPYAAQPLLDLVHAHGRLADVARITNPAQFAQHREAAAQILGMMEADGRAATSGEFSELRAWVAAMGAE